MYIFTDIFIDIFKLLSVILLFVFMLGQIGYFKQMIYKKLNHAETAILIVFFGALSIIGTYGFHLENVVANTRAVGAIVGGLIAGPLVGTGAGLIAGLHRYFLGGLTSKAAGLSVLLQGLLAGGYFKIKKRRVNYLEGFIVGAVLEILHFAIVLAITKPFSAALDAVLLIAPPMIIVNSLGVSFFILMLEGTTQVQTINGGFQHNPVGSMELSKKVLPIKTDERVVIVNYDDIFLIKALGQGKVEIVTNRGNYITSATLKDLISKLDYPVFLRTHKSFILNTDKITEVIPWFNSTYIVTMDGCNENDIPISRHHIKEFNDLMGIL